MLIIDRDENTPASREAHVLKSMSELVNLLREKAKSPLKEERAEKLPEAGDEIIRENKK